MIAYACYVMWLIMIGASQSYTPEQVERFIRAIHSAFGKCDWYRGGLFEEVWDSIQTSLAEMKPGPQTGVLVPLVHVIEAANRAGCHIQHTNDLPMMMHSSVVMGELTKAAASPRPWRRFGKV